MPRPVNALVMTMWRAPAFSRKVTACSVGVSSVSAFVTMPMTGRAKDIENIWGRRQMSFPQSWQKQTMSAS